MKNAKVTKEELFYESIAGEFDNVMNRYEVSKRLDIIFKKILKSDIKGKTFLDVGCGTGLFSQAAYEKKANVTSLDVGPKLLKQVAKKCKSKLVVGSVTNLPFKDNSFDIVIATEIIEHTSDPKKAVAELCRVVKPKGTLIITMPNKVWKFSLFLADLLRIRPYHAFENWLFWWDLNGMIKSNKCKVKKSFGFNIIPFFHPLLQPAITSADSYGSGFGKLVMVNMAFVVTK